MNIIKLKKTFFHHSWKTVEFLLNNQLFSGGVFRTRFNSFWEKVSNELNDGNHMYIIFKIKYIGSDYTTIGNLQRLNLGDKNWYIDWIINNMIYKSDYYNETPIESFIFSYGFKSGLAEMKQKNNSNFQTYKNNKLVTSYNPLEYGKLIHKTENVYFVQVNEKIQWL